jgi:predicted GNAT superfamily acetyltransferase
MHSMIAKPPTSPERSEMVISLLVVMSALPSLFKSVTTVICHERDRGVPRIFSLLRQAYKIRSSLSRWKSKYHSFAISNAHTPTVKEGYFGFLAIFYTTFIFIDRIIAAMCWEDSPLVAELEGEAQRLAMEVLTLQQESLQRDSQGALLMAQKNRVAEATILTHDDWRRSVPSDTSPCLVEKEAFERWCDLFGRKTS